MALTETRPEEVEAAAPPPRPAVSPGPVGWLTSVDHKRVGLAYIWTALAFLVVGGGAALVIRFELVSPRLQILKATTNDQLFTLHTGVSVFLFLVPLWLGLATYLVPLQIGARGVALPRLHALAYWLFLSGGLMVVVSYLIRGGPYAARFLLFFDDASGVHTGRASQLWIFGMGAVSVGAVLAAVDLITTIVKLRAPGLTALRLPPFTWATLVASSVVVLATPVFVAGLGLLYADVRHGGHVFTGTAASRVLWQHVLWLYGRPELYALLVVALGVLAEVVTVHGRRPFADYRALLVALAVTGALSFAVWAYDGNGLRATVLPSFSAFTALVYLPAAVVVLLCLQALAGGRPRVSAALLHGVGAVLLLLMGAAGALSAAAVHVRPGSEWASSHVHVVLFGVVLLAVLAAFFHWAPKLWGRHLSEGMGIVQFLLLLVGAALTFVPGYTALRDQPRLRADYPAGHGWTGLNRVATAGAIVIGVAVLLFAANLVVSVVARRGHPASGDPWNGATLEWYTASPPPAHNFDSLPEIRSERPLLDLPAAAAVDEEASA